MPSGAKKRKAARRKKGMGVRPPDSPANPSPGNGESHDSKGETSDEGEEKKGESPRSESVAGAAMDSSEDGKEKPGEETAKVTESPPKEEKEKEKEKVVEEETVAMPVSMEAEAVSVELVRPEKEEEEGGGGGGERSAEVAEEKPAAAASVVAAHEPVSAGEEVLEAKDAAAVTPEALARESEVKPAPIFDTPPAPVTEQPQPRESGELCHESERSEAAPAPLVERRATWWNCCGLFDVFTSSRDAVRT